MGWINDKTAQGKEIRASANSWRVFQHIKFIKEQSKYQL
jgi:hypothetical protein